MSWLQNNYMTIIYLAMTVLPSIVTALGNYPQTAGAVPWLRALMDFFSILTHKDSPGTLKLPLQRSQKPTK